MLNNKNLVKAFLSLIVLFVLGVIAYFSGSLIPNSYAQTVGAPAFESHYNPFGDAWSSNLGPNSDIPVALTSGCYRRGPRYEGANRPSTEVSDAEIDYLAKSSVPIIFEECANIQSLTKSVQTPGRLKNLATKLKAKNPAAKYIGYFVFSQPDYMLFGFQDIWQGADNDQYCGEHKCESYYLHKKGTAPTKANRVDLDPSGAGNYVLDITNPNYRQYIASKIAAYMNEINMDGFLSDGVGPYPAGTTEDSKSQIPDNWAQAWQDLFRDVKAATGPNKLIFANTSSQNLNFTRSILENDSFGNPRADGIMWEDPLGSVQAGIKDNYSGSTTRETMINQTLGIVESLNKQLMFVVNTNAGSNCGTGGGSLDFCFKNTNRERELDYQRYYLAGYLNFFRGSKTFLTYYTPTESGPQFNSEAFFKDWNTKIGQPLGTNQEVAPGVYRRIFANAQVYWNNSTVDHRINFGGPVYTLDGEQVVNYTIKAKSGMIFTTSTSNPSPTPTPTPTPTPSPTATPNQTTCTPAGQSVLVNEQVTLVTNRANNVSWDAVGATPSTGTSQTFTTKFSQPGDYEVIVVWQSDSSQVAVCKVSVKSPNPTPTPSVTPTPTPSPSPSPTPNPTPSPSTFVIPVNEVSKLELTTAGYIGKFFSSKQNEFEFLISRGWTKLNTVFKGPAASVPGATMAIRFMQNDDTNLTQTLTWAASEEDINYFLSQGFSKSQDADFYVYLIEQPGTVPVTRMKLNHQNKTFYTFSTSPEETENLISQGWEIQKEKIFFVYP